jgi:hypothetical protein
MAVAAHQQREREHQTVATKSGAVKIVEEFRALSSTSAAFAAAQLDVRAQKKPPPAHR